VLRGRAFGLTFPDGDKVAASRWYSDRPAIRRRIGLVVAAKNLGDVVAIEPLPAGVTVRRWK
jgi:hypothetical protein